VAEFVPENWVILRLGERKRLHFFHHVKVTRVTTDPITGEPRRRESLVFYVDEEDGVKVDRGQALPGLRHHLHRRGSPAPRDHHP